MIDWSLLFKPFFDLFPYVFCMYSSIQILKIYVEIKHFYEGDIDSYLTTKGFKKQFGITKSKKEKLTLKERLMCLRGFDHFREKEDK